jgi:hypothetical protein
MPVNDQGSSEKPVFSVIIPLEFHRGQWERCWQCWNAQTVGKSAYEIIVVVPPDFRDFALLSGLPANFVKCSSPSDEINPCAVGAARARGKYLFFTEAHCWPEPDVLELCLAAISASPDRAGFTCSTIPLTPNRLSEAEASMYVADIENALQVHSWPRNLYQGFVTTREAYDDCGGFRSELGQFAEWALAASYLQRDYDIGYFPKAKFYHYYSGSLRALTAFTLNFATGEMRYFDEHCNQYYSRLLEIPPEWICQANFDSDTARSVLHIAVQSLLPLGRTYRHLPHSIARIGRWIAPAVFGDRIARLSAAAAAALAGIALLFAIATGSREHLNCRFRKYISALIRAQRLATIGIQRRTGRDAIQPGYVGFDLDAFALDATGFYPLEQYQESKFRWSETAAGIIVYLPAGPQKIGIHCIPVRDLSDAKSDLRFYIDGVCVPSSQLSIELNEVNLSLDVDRPEIVKLGWTCLPFSAVADSRQLGLPIKRIELSAAPDG